MKTKPFTLIVCPGCLTVKAIPKDWHGGVLICECGKQVSFDHAFRLGLKKIEETGEEIWVGVKED